MVFSDFELFKRSCVMPTLTDLFGGLVRRFNTWRERERAFAELNALDDRTLADLGLRRADIPFVVYCKAREQAAAAAQDKPLRSAGKSGDNAIHAT